MPHDRDPERSAGNAVHHRADTLGADIAPAHQSDSGQGLPELLETAVEGIVSNRHHPQPAMHCSWCQYRNECMAWLPGMTVGDIHQQHAA